LQAKDLTGIKIYVDPGHGGFTSNDRNIATPGHPTSGHPLSTWNDETGFWESQSNLDKGFYLRDRLLEQNATVRMQRVTNTEADDVDMQTRADDAESFGADVFISIHSNAANRSANYLYLMYRNPNETGNPGEPPFPSADVVNTSIAMARHAFPFLLDNSLNSWTAYYPYNPSNINIRADNGIGVQRRMMMSGFLSEGSFHDYVPETCRLLNLDYKHLEALRMFRYFVDYYGADKETTGTLAGYVKTQDAKMQTVFGALSFTYHASSDDQWHPLNGATVKLFNAGGTLLDTYTVDNEYNGIFVFYDLEPGNYKLEASIDGYLSETVDVTVTAAKTSNQKIFLKDESAVIPDPDPVNYPDPEQDENVLALNEYEFFQQGTALSAPWLNENNIKRAIHRNGKLYILTKDAAPKIFIADPNTLDIVKEMNLTGISGGQISISDIAFTADDKLLACNKELIAMPESSGRLFKVYIWDNDDAVPALYFEMAGYAGANFSQGLVGETMAVSGPSWNSTMYLPVISRLTEGAGSWNVIRFVTIEKETDVPPVAAYYGWADQGSIYKVGNWGENFQLMISPRADNYFIVTSSDILPTELQLNKEEGYANNSMPGGDYAVIRKGVFTEKGGYELFKTNGANYFRYAGKIYMAAPVAKEGRVNAGVVLFDITDGLDNAVKVSEQLPEDGLGTAAAPYMTAYGTVDNYDIFLTLLAENQGLAVFKTDLTPEVESSSVNYPDPIQDKDVKALNEYQFIQQGTVLDAPWLNEDNIKRAIHRDGKLYVLSDVEKGSDPTAKVPKISVYDATNLSHIKDLSLTGVSGGRRIISDIGFTSDGKLLGCNLDIVAISSGGTPVDEAAVFKVYIWDNDNADPDLFYRLGKGENDWATGQWFNSRLGETMAVSGPSSECTVYMPAWSGTPGANSYRLVSHLKTEGSTAVAAKVRMNGGSDAIGNGGRNFEPAYPDTWWGNDFQFTISPRGDDYFVVTSNGMAPVECYFNRDHSLQRTDLESTVSFNGGPECKTIGANYFRYAKHSYMAAPVAKEGRVSAGVVLFDITEGFDKALKVSEQLPEAGLGTVAAPYMMAYGTVDNKDITLAILAENQGFAKFKTTFDTGLNPPVKQAEIRIYPNPVENIVHIDCERPIESIRLIDLTGRSVMNFPANQTAIDLSGVKAGSYILLVNNQPVKVIKK